VVIMKNHRSLPILKKNHRCSAHESLR